MEPLAGLSLASNVFQFVEAGISLVQKAREIKSSHSRLDASNALLDADAERMLKLCTYIRGVQTDKSLGMEKIINQCHIQSLELQHLLETLRPPHGRGTLDSVRKAFKTYWTNDKIQDLAKALDRSRDALIIHLSASVHNRVDDLKTLIGSTMLSTNSDATRERQMLLQSHKTILDRIDQLDQSNHLMAQTNATGLTTQELRSAFRDILRYPNMNRRYTNVAIAHQSSFAWIFDQFHNGARVPFVDWLQSQSGVFWITGKPGSGKSTLMKSIWSSSQTTEYLAVWNGGHAPVLGHFFFWPAGWGASKGDDQFSWYKFSLYRFALTGIAAMVITPAVLIFIQIGDQNLQQSQQGLLRSLLFEILTQDPSAIDKTIEHIDLYSSTKSSLARVQEELLETHRLHEILQIITKQGVVHKKFCFFIDGLDEYQGPPQELCDLIRTLTSTENVKICVSSRPWNEFEVAFGADVTHKILVQDHTQEDMRSYTHDILEQEAAFVKLRCENPAYETLVRKLVQKSSGVFLWIFLVVRELRNNLANEDSIADFERRIEAFPDDLEDFFIRMLQSIPKIYQARSAKIILMLLQSVKSERLNILCPILDDRLDPLKIHVASMDTHDLEHHLSRARRRLNSHCRDLIEVRLGNDPGIRGPGHCKCVTQAYNVDFLHRSVRDFLNQAAIKTALVQRASSSYDPCLELCRSYLFDLKTLPWACCHDPGSLGPPIYGNNGLTAALDEVIPCMLVHATCVEPENRMACLELLDEADRSTRLMLQNIDNVALDEYECSSVVSSTTLDGRIDFLSPLLRLKTDVPESVVLQSAACIGPLWYAKPKIIELVTAKRCHTEAQYMSNRLLLQAAVYGFKPPQHPAPALDDVGLNQYFSIMFCDWSYRMEWTVHLEIVETLLRYGANPNEPLRHGYSVWYWFLARLCKYVEQLRPGRLFPEEIQAALFILLKLFIHYGADSTAQVCRPGSDVGEKFQFDGKYSIHDILEWFNQDVKDEILQLLQQAPRHTRRASNAHANPRYSRKIQEVKKMQSNNSFHRYRNLSTRIKRYLRFEE